MFLHMLFDFLFNKLMTKKTTNERPVQQPRQVAWSYDNSSIQRFSIQKLIEENEI
jgi:hypothetical protein